LTNLPSREIENKKERKRSDQHHCVSVFYGSLNIKLLHYITSQQKEEEKNLMITLKSRHESNRKKNDDDE
jgi:hypothetical protein